MQLERFGTDHHGENMKYLIPVLPVVLGFMLDCIVGDPYSVPHPIKLIGRLIGGLEKFVRKHMRALRLGEGLGHGPGPQGGT